ncbi:MAG: AzlC family ABC transporter permease, partial [Bacillota bacterium]
MKPAPEHNQLTTGARAALPIVLGYVPIGLAFGVLAVQQGLGVPGIFLMSLIVYAGSAQFIATGMLAAGASPTAIIATTFLVNLRHLLMSASMSAHLRHIHPT